MTTAEQIPPPKRGRGRPRSTPKFPLQSVILPPDRAGFKVAEVARLLGISESHAYVLVDRGEFVSFHIGSSRRITADSVAAFIQRQVAAEGRPA